MELFILRHGDAENGFPDSQRQLSDYGRQQVTRIAKQHAHSLANLEAVITSPLSRASQTADIVMSKVPINCARQISNSLLPNAQITHIENFLETQAVNNLLLIGHLPLLNNLINYLVGDNIAKMATASLASLSMSHAYRGLATLNWIHHAD